jgi:hypothetical protein
MAEDAARELPNLPVEDTLQLVHLYVERKVSEFEPAVRRWLAPTSRKARRARKTCERRGEPGGAGARGGLN